VLDCKLVCGGERPSLLNVSGNGRTGLQVGMWRETAVKSPPNIARTQGGTAGTPAAAQGRRPRRSEDAIPIDLVDPAIFYNSERWEQMWNDLAGWQSGHSNYANVPFIVPPVDNPFPAPFGAFAQ
jgi:hypothetical protein